MTLTLDTLRERADQAQEAWEVLATEGWIPVAWLDRPTWRFTCVCNKDPLDRWVFRARQGMPAEMPVPPPCRVCEGKGSLAHPPTVERAWLFAQAPSEHERAEMLLDEAHAILRTRTLDDYPKARPPILWRYRMVLGGGSARVLFTAQPRPGKTARPRPATARHSVVTYANGKVYAGTGEIRALCVEALRVLSESKHEVLDWTADAVEIAWG